MKQKIKTLLTWFIKTSLIVKLVVVGLLILIAWLTLTFTKTSKKTDISYQTSTAQIGTLITSVSGSGKILSGSSTNITTASNGTITKVYLSNGDTVVKGQKIADISLDEEGIEQQSNAYQKYIEAKEAVTASQKAKIDADLAMWQARQNIINSQEAFEDRITDPINPATGQEYTVNEKAIIDKTLEQARADFSLNELKYKNADIDITNAQVKLAAAWRDYQLVSSSIYAPSSGTVSNLNLSPGTVIVSESSSSTNLSGLAVVSQNIGNIDNPNAQLQAQVSLSELDIISVKANQKVTLTLDAYPDLTFTGKVLAVDTSGGSSQGVTTYTATILLDKTTVDIYPNMAVTADIMLDIKPDVLLVVSSAVKSDQQGSYVEVLQDGKPSKVSVEVGSSNDSETIILSGLDLGQEIISATIDTSQEVEFGGSSPFGGGMGGGVIRMR